MVGKSIRFVILAVVVGVAFRLFYAWLSEGGGTPPGLDTLAGLVGLLVASVVTSLLEWKQRKEKTDG